MISELERAQEAKGFLPSEEEERHSLYKPILV